VFTLFSGDVRVWSTYVWFCALTVASPDPRLGRVLTRYHSVADLLPDEPGGYTGYTGYAAFGTFFAGLAKAGITKANTLFVITADEGDHFVGGRQARRTATACRCSAPTRPWARWTGT
jgi:hypothetical protein